jgi:hypothetical protein
MIQRIWASIEPINGVNESGLACNTPGTAPPSYIPITAGQDLTAVYWWWLHPVGPMSVWLADCGESCEDVDVNKIDFFKIWEAGCTHTHLFVFFLYLPLQPPLSFPSFFFFSLLPIRIRSRRRIY